MRHVLLSLSALAVGALAVAFLAGFMWPEARNADHPASVNLGPLDQFEPGTMTAVGAVVEHNDLRWQVRPVVSPRTSRDVGLWVARHEDGAVRVFLARDPQSGCTLPWRETFRHEGREGWFRSPYCGSTFNRYGQWVAGDAPRDMDWFEVSVDRNGDLVVDLRTLHAGDRHHGIPADERAASAASTMEHGPCVA